MKDKIEIYSNLQSLNKKCRACPKRDHNIYNCPEIHYVPRKDFIIRRYLYSKPTIERKFEKRRKAKRHNALKIANLLQEKMFFFFDAIELRQEEIFNEENTVEEFSESDLNDLPDSPMISAALPRKVSIDSTLLRVFPEDDGQKAREEEKDRVVNFEGDHPNKKKESCTQPGMLSIAIPNTTVKRGSKVKLVHQMSSLKKCETTGSIKMSNHQPLNLKSWDHDFERLHIFSRYFVKNNVDVVLKKLENFMIKKAARIQKLRNLKKKKTLIGSPLRSSRYHKSSFMKKNGGKTRFNGQNNEVSEDNRSVMQSPHYEISSSWNLEEKSDNTNVFR